MTDELLKPRFQIVRSPKRMEVSPKDFQDPKSQGMLFPLPRYGLLIFMHFPDITEEEFRETLEYSKPSFVLELRASPRFDIGRLNRQLAFQAFQSQNTTYMDLTSSLMGKIDRDAVLGSLHKFLHRFKPSFDQPVMLLLNRIESDERFLKNILATITAFNSSATEIYEVPRFSTIPLAK
jgi:hypothetical protein